MLKEKFLFLGKKNMADLGQCFYNVNDFDFAKEMEKGIVFFNNLFLKLFIN